MNEKLKSQRAKARDAYEHRNAGRLKGGSISIRCGAADRERFLKLRDELGMGSANFLRELMKGYENG